MRRRCAMAIALALCVQSPGIRAATTYDWKAGSGTWDDVTTANWTPAGIPTNGDTINLTLSTNGNLGIDYDSTNFLDGNVAAYLTAGNAGGGRTTLTIGEGATFTFLYDMIVGNGADLVQTGGRIDSTGGWMDNLMFQGDATCVLVGGTNVTDRHIEFGDNVGENVTMIISNGVFGNDEDGDFRCREGNSSFTMEDGKFDIVRSTLIGTISGDHVWNLKGGVFKPYALFLGGGSGTVTFNHTGGTVYRFLKLYSGASYFASGGAQPNWPGVTIDGGTMQLDGVAMTNAYAVGMGVDTTNGTGRLIVTNGASINCGDALLIANLADSTSIVIQYTNTVIRAVKGLKLGEDGYTAGPGSGTYLVTGGRFDWNNKTRIDANGLLRGYGDVNGWSWGESFTMNGKIMADGEGQDRTLDMDWGYYASYRQDTDPYVHNTQENTGSNGWYAINGGRLELAPMWVFPEASTPSVSWPPLYGKSNDWNWGEWVLDGEIDLVNSARLQFTNLGTGIGWLSGSLLAADRTEVPAGLWAPIGIWQFSTTAPITYDSVVVTFRYDDAAAGQVDAEPGEWLRIMWWQDDKWQDVTANSGVDLVNHRISSSIGMVTDLSTYFAVSFVEPTKGMLVTIK